MVILVLATGLWACVTNPTGQQRKTSANGLEKAFATPPDESKPWVMMWWMVKVTPDDITRHMEELKAKGVGGIIVFDVGQLPGVKFLSEPWRVLFRHAVKEADRLGMKVGCNVCDGWPSGGKWISPENSSWMTVSSTTTIKGPQKFSGSLPEPTGKGELYLDLAVQAFPVTDADPPQASTLTASDNPGQIPNLLDGNYNTSWKGGSGNPWILIDFGTPHLVDRMWVDVAGDVVLEASGDGRIFRPVAKAFAPLWHNVIFENVPATRARWFRVLVPGESEVRDIALGTREEVDRFAGMAAKRALTNPLGVTGTPQADQVAFVRKDLVPMSDDRPLKTGKMIDLTPRCAPDGTLTWDVPTGVWKVVRIGQTTTGIGCGGGLLTDYLNTAAMDQNYGGALNLLMEDAGPLTGKTFQYFHEDNVEIGGLYSWTPGFIEEFKQRRGYDPKPYLSAMAGEIIENVEFTDRFLADIRRTIADCVADNHYGRWAELAHQRGMKVRGEAGGQHHPRLLCNDGLMNQGRVDIPAAEFWESHLWKENQQDPRNHHEAVPPGWDEPAQNVNAKQTASAAHLYGKQLVSSESFTSLGPRQNWGVGPGDLLLYANIAFCEGINLMTIHGSATSGPQNGKPGTAFFAGTHFNHNVSWWEMAAKPFLSYLGRCQHMLRQGLFVADVLYYSGDEAPNFIPPKNLDPSRGFGYDYDVCNTEILLTRLSVKDGMIVLPDGMSYRLLVLPERQVIPLAVALKIDELVAAGATILGPKPMRTPGLTGYPQSEEQLKAITDKLWIRQECGKGRVLNGPAIREVLGKDGIGPDFSFATDSDSALMDFIHRRDGATEIYFVINRRAKTLRADCTFRISGKQPELWDPMTGKTRLAPEFRETDGGTVLPLELAPYGSVFVVFTDTPACVSQPSVHNFPGYEPVMELTGAWEVKFDPEWGGPETVQFDRLVDWTTRPEPGIRIYSGNATYRKTFDLPSGLEKGRSLSLNLGTVKNVATVRLNGRDLGVVWAEPCTIGISDAVKPSGNILEVEVVNLWRNRMIGDAALPPAQRLTRSNITMNPNDKLVVSGLLGPVKIVVEKHWP